MRKPRYIVVPCAWCANDTDANGVRMSNHWLVKRNILTSRAIAATSAWATQETAQAEADRLNRAC